MKNSNRRRSEKGFTLIELATVLGIIVILAAIAYPSYSNMRKKALASEGVNLVQEVRQLAWTYYIENGKFDGYTYSQKTDGWSISGQATTQNNQPVFEIIAQGIKDTKYDGITVTLTLSTNGTATVSTTY